MRNTKKWARTAFILIVIGLVLGGVAFALADFKLENLTGHIIIENTYEPEGEFDKIHIEIHTADVIFAHSEDSKTRVEVRETETLPHTVEIRDNTLRITSKDLQKWTDRLSFGNPQTSVTVYLPKAYYEAAFVETVTGDVSVPIGFSFGDLDVRALTGKLSLSGISAWNMSVNSTTGRIILTDIDAQKKLYAHMTTGDVSMKGVKARNMTVYATTGDVMMNDVIVEELMSIRVTTGDINFRKTDAGEVFMKCTTGDIDGSFLTDKIFEAEATTGHVSVPATKTGGICRAETTTGHIQITIGG